MCKLDKITKFSTAVQFSKKKLLSELKLVVLPCSVYLTPRACEKTPVHRIWGGSGGRELVKEVTAAEAEEPQWCGSEKTTNAGVEEMRNIVRRKAGARREHQAQRNVRAMKAGEFCESKLATLQPQSCAEDFVQLACLSSINLVFIIGVHTNYIGSSDNRRS